MQNNWKEKQERETVDYGQLLSALLCQSSAILLFPLLLNLEKIKAMMIIAQAIQLVEVITCFDYF